MKAGDKVPDVYGKLNDADKRKIIIGNAKIGGPVDYMYIGPMNLRSTYSDGVLTLDGKLIGAKKYADEHELYFRLRARRNDQTFDPSVKYPNGTPKIYSKSPSKGDSAGRIMVVDKPAENREIITF